MAWDWLYLSLLISRKCLVQSTWCQSWYSSSSWWHLIRAKIGAFLTIRLVRWMWSILTQWESKELRFLDKTKSKSLLLRFHFEVPEASNFFTNSTIAVVPENAGTRKLAEMLSRELPNVEFSFYQVETSANLWQLHTMSSWLFRVKRSWRAFRKKIRRISKSNLPWSLPNFKSD